MVFNPYSFIDCNILTGCTSVLSGLTGPYITGATYDSTTGCLTFYRQSGATFSACGFLTGATSTSSSSGYWSAGTKGIYYTGGTNTYVGIGTQNTTKTLTVQGSVSSTSTLDVGGDTTLSSQLNVSGTTTIGEDLNILQSRRIYFGSDVNTQTSIRETSSNLRIESDDDILFYPDDDVKIGVSSTQYAIFDGGTKSLIVGGTSVPTGRLTLYNPDQTYKITEIDGGEECSDSFVYEDMKSSQASNMSLVFGEAAIVEGVPNHAFHIYPYPHGDIPNENYSSDIILGGYKISTDCPIEVLRIDGSTLRVGIKNSSPAYDLDVTGSINADSIYSAGTELDTIIKIIGGRTTGKMVRSNSRNCIHRWVYHLCWYWYYKPK